MFVLLLMLFMHIIDDYYKQGILASMKQKEWWKSQKEYKPLYKYDYVIALAMHSFSWAFMIMLPIAVMQIILAKSVDVSAEFVVILFANAIIHGIVDDLKANKKTINLIVDQSIHIAQIFITWAILAR